MGHTPGAEWEVGWAREFNTLMVDFYRHREGTAVVAFLTDCHPDAEELMSAAARRPPRE